jgi:hypothetical protein
MKHARADYDRIQDPEGKIPANEPVFLIRGQDFAGPATVRAWVALQLERGDHDARLVELAEAHAERMELWQRDNGCKVPDL